MWANQLVSSYICQNGFAAYTADAVFSHRLFTVESCSTTGLNVSTLNIILNSAWLVTFILSKPSCSQCSLVQASTVSTKTEFWSWNLSQTGVPFCCWSVGLSCSGKGSVYSESSCGVWWAHSHSEGFPGHNTLTVLFCFSDWV